MPYIGEIASGKDIGKKSTSLFIYSACEDCGESRWVRLREGKFPEYKYCHRCCHKWNNLSAKSLSSAISSIKNRKKLCGENHPFWKGGRWINSAGYVEVWLPKDSPFFPMTAGRKGYVLEHRLVVAQHIGRCLKPWEVVHHRNGIKTDNRRENLELLPRQSKHNKEINKYIRKLEKRVKGLEERVILIEAENVLLKHGGIEMGEGPQLQKIEYFRVVKNPTLKQFLHRRHVQEVMQQVKGETGMGTDPDTKKNTPVSALKAKELLTGVNADDLMKLHPDWVEDYNKEYGE
jgi:hypothetical protein